ncbi:hypothetical protein BVRB_1g013390 [Beta vulgaris subsp. vulgaris]|nr:hypothetical protein BVRB_1g013390 [Beta vulgaris subsp. vulgaris]
MVDECAVCASRALSVARVCCANVVCKASSCWVSSSVLVSRRSAGLLAASRRRVRGSSGGRRLRWWSLVVIHSRAKRILDRRLKWRINQRSK